MSCIYWPDCEPLHHQSSPLGLSQTNACLIWCCTKTANPGVIPDLYYSFPLSSSNSHPVSAWGNVLTHLLNCTLWPVVENGKSFQVYFVVPHFNSISCQQLARRCFLSEVEVILDLSTFCLVKAVLVGSSRTSYVGKSRQSCESGHACLNNGYLVGG